LFYGVDEFLPIIEVQGEGHIDSTASNQRVWMDREPT